MKQKAVKALQSKTIIFSLLLAGAGALQITLPELQAFVPPSVYGYLTIITAIIVAVLRAVTTTPLLDE